MVFGRRPQYAAVWFFTFSSLLSAAPRLSLSATTIGPVNTVPGSNGAAQTVQATNIGDGSLNLTATSSAPWLSATVGAKGTCPGNCYLVSISLNTASLAAGTYTEYVTLSDAAAVDSPQDIAVTVNTTGVPSSITAYVTPTGGPSPNAIFNIYTTGTNCLQTAPACKGTVTTQTGGKWLSFLSGSSGLIPSPSPWLIQVAAQVGQAPGSYSGSVAIAGSSASTDNKTVAVTLNVTQSPIIQVNNAAIRLTASEGGTPQYAVVSLNNVGLGTLTVSGAAGSAAFLTASVNGASGLLITADPKGLKSGVYSGAVTITSNAANNAQVSIPVELVVAPAGQPLISSGGIVNVANYAQEGVSQGDIVAVFGNQLAPAGTSASNAATPLATTLGGVQVLVNDVAVPLYYSSPGQINFQVPYSLAPGSTATVQVVSNGTKGNIRSLAVNASAPRLLYFVSFIAGNYGVIVNGADGSLTLPTGTVVPGFTTHPAKPGDTIVVYAVGFGQTSPAATEGQAANNGNNGQLQSITNVTSTFGGGFTGRSTAGKVVFAGLTPTAVGLYQANITIPADTPLGASVPVSIVVNGVQSNPVYLAITASGK